MRRYTQRNNSTGVVLTKIVFFASFLFCCLSIFLHPKKTILSKALVYCCFLVFRCIGEYISLHLFYFVSLTSSCLLTGEYISLDMFYFVNLTSSCSLIDEYISLTSVLFCQPHQQLLTHWWVHFPRYVSLVSTFPLHLFYFVNLTSSCSLIGEYISPDLFYFVNLTRSCSLIGEYISPDLFYFVNLTRSCSLIGEYSSLDLF